MVAALAAAALIVAASLTVGQAALTLCARPDDRVVAGPVGLALLLATAAIAAGLGGRGAAIAISLCALTGVAAGVLLRGGLPSVPRHARIAPILAALLAGLFAALPFIAAGRVGILGVGLVNDDMASHLLLADWIAERFDPEPVLVDQGYPLGPHALVAGLGSLLGARTIDVFAGLVLAIPALTAFLAAGVLSNLRLAPRVACSALVALPYLIAAYLAQEAFKEPIVALFLLGFAILLPTTRDWRGAIAVGFIAAGTVYVYSFPGLAWLAATALIWAAFQWQRGARTGARMLPTLIGVSAALLVLVALDLDRLRDFVDFRALDPGRANEGGLGNLHGHLSPLEALGIWPTSEFRLGAGEGSGPAIAFYAGALVAATAVAFGLPGWLRRHGAAIPAALAAALLMYFVARAFGTVYSEGKALAIVAPLVALIAFGAVGATTLRRALAVAFAVGVALSSFLVLRQAPVAPETHMDELAEIRPIVEGEKLLFLGRDNFVLWELRGSKPFTHVRNFYDPYFVEPNFDLANVGSKFDFDSVTAETLFEFPYVITTRAAYASGPPPGYTAELQTASYVLWRKVPVRDTKVIARHPVEPDSRPGAVLRCRADRDPSEGEDLLERSMFAAGPTRAPVSSEAAGWSPSPSLENGASASQTFRLRTGTWDVSLQYDATRPVRVIGPGLDATLPGNLDYRGVVPYWNVGEITVEGDEPVTLTASVDEPPVIGRLLGADSVAHLGAVAATRAGPSYIEGAEAPFPGAGESVQAQSELCGAYADWTGLGSPDAFR